MGAYLEYGLNEDYIIVLKLTNSMNEKNEIATNIIREKLKAQPYSGYAESNS